MSRPSSELEQPPPPRPAWLQAGCPGRIEGESAIEITAFESDAAATASDLIDFLPTDTTGRVPPLPHPFRHPLRAAAWVIRMLFGIASLIVLLAVIAAIPIINFLALGYLLEAEGRLARTGKLRFAFPLLDLAPRFGAIVVGVWLWILPLRWLSSAAADARLIDPAGNAARTLPVVTAVLAVLITLHLCLALARGGSLGTFFRPLKNLLWLARRIHRREYWTTAEAHVREFVAGLRIRHHFWLSLRGFFGAAAWLIVPSALFAILRDTDRPAQILLTLVGGLLLIPALALVPFLQARFAAENRGRAFFEPWATIRLFVRAPLAWLLAVVLVYVLSLPLYLLKVALPPRDAMWLLTLIFIASIYPARIVTGWAYHRATTKPARITRDWRWMLKRVVVPALSIALMLPLLGLYVFLLYFTQFIGEQGKAVLLEHHALLLPVPF